MMNEFLPTRYVELVRRGVLGLEIWDILCRSRLSRPIDVLVEGPATLVARLRAGRPPCAGDRGPCFPPFTKRSVHLYALCDDTVREDSVDVRLCDPTRAYAPRRLHIPVTPLDPLHEPSPWLRLRRVAVFPGAAFPMVSGLTGLRGTVRRESRPVRWTRVEARRVGSAAVIGRAQGDERGEFLLILSAEAARIGDLESTIAVTVSVLAPDEPDPATFKMDPLGDLALEVLGEAAPGTDRVAMGRVDPPGYQTLVQEPVDLSIGRVSHVVLSV